MLNRLFSSISAACPIVGVAVGTPGDSSTVRIDFAAEATDEQKAAAQAVLAAFDWTDTAATQQAARSNIADTYGALPLAVRVAFAPCYVSAERFLDLGQWDVAIALIQACDAPAGMEQVKAGFIAALEAAQP